MAIVNEMNAPSCILHIIIEGTRSKVTNVCRIYSTEREPQGKKEINLFFCISLWLVCATFSWEEMVIIFLITLIIQKKFDGVLKLLLVI